MKKKLYVIKNKVTGKYFGNNTFAGKCTYKHIEDAEMFDEKWLKEYYEDGLESTLGKNEQFIEIEIREKK